MKPEELLTRQHALLHVLSGLPTKILSWYSLDYLPVFVLHEIACKDCFNLNKAAFLIDNPDFDLLKGVAGISREESYAGNSPIWDDRDQFMAHMQRSTFNDKVRNHLQVSCKRQSKPDAELFGSIADELGMQNYNVCSWNMKHDNHGYLMYEKADHDDTACDDYIIHGASMLGFCPIH